LPPANLPTVSLIAMATLPPVSNLPPVSGGKFTAGVVDTGGKFAAGVVDNGGAP
jgi:hypothetical protein